MMSGIMMALAFLVAISLLVAVHEYGHYLVARLCGIKVLRFSIGFGKPIWLKRAGVDQTEYCISALPLGGYVRMLDEREGDVAEADRHRSFQAQPIWQRIAVLLAGPLFNFLFVIVAFWCLFVIGIPQLAPIVGQIREESPAAQAGLLEGSSIVSVNGSAVTNWESAFIEIINDIVGDGEVSLSVLAPDTNTPRKIVLNVPADVARLEEPGAVMQSLGIGGIRPPAAVSTVRADGAAASGGMLPGDIILAINGQPIEYFEEIRGALNAIGEPTEVDVLVSRDGFEKSLRISPELEKVGDQKLLMLGVGSAGNERLRSVYRLGVLDAFPAAIGRLVDETSFTVRMLGQMLSGNVSAKNLSGPVSIAKYAGEAAARGFDDYIRFLAVISISLGILNLLPIPMLDGGQIVYQTIEWAKGSPVSERTQLLGQQFGIFVLLGVMVFAFYNDLSRIFGS